MTQHVRKGRKAREQRRESAAARDLRRSKRSAKEQLRIIDKRPGESRRERARLLEA